jgi:hypothetical protein
MPATHAKVCCASYSERNFLQPDAEFMWPNAPTEQGATTDLRRTPDQRFAHYTMQLLDPNLQIAFISACNPSQNFLVVYAFRRADFPWVGNWEEKTIARCHLGMGEHFVEASSSAQRPTPFPAEKRSTKVRSSANGPTAGFQPSRAWRFAS